MVPLVDKIPRRFRGPVYAAATFLGVSGMAATCGGDNPQNDTSGTSSQPEASQNLDPNRFLQYPVRRDERIKIQQGWDYSFATKNSHNGIDYIMGDIDNSNTWKTFPVMAAAEGEACVNPPKREGTAVFIRHDRPGGKTYYTYYGHLSEVKGDIPQCVQGDKVYKNLKHVAQGEGIGESGASGVTDTAGNPQPKWKHLHFGVIGPDGANVDPYDKRSTRDQYPDLLFNNNLTCGDKTLWVVCPTDSQAQLMSTKVVPPTVGPVETVGVPQIPTVESKKGSRVIDFSFQDSSGRWVKVSEDVRFANKPILVFYYGRAFGASESDLEVIRRIKGEFANLAIMPVIMDDDKYLAQHLSPGLGEIYTDEQPNVQSSDASSVLEIHGYPTTIILDKDHKIVFRQGYKLSEPDVARMKDIIKTLEQ